MDKSKEIIKEKVNEAIELLKIICEVLLENDVVSSKNYTLSNLVSEFDINPQYGQITTDSCFVIEEYYYIPNRIYTPIGYIKIPCRIYCGKESIIEKVHETLNHRINLQLCKQAEKTDVGLIGGWFKIGNAEPLFKDRGDYIGYLDSYDIFDTCLKNYILNMNK